MGYFRGCKSLFLMLMIITVFIVCCLRTSTAEEGNGNGNLLYQLLTREELVHMAGYGEEKLSTVLVTGTVVCEACLHGEDQLRSWPISGALVTVNCHNSNRRTISNSQAVTDEYGDFMIDLPSHLHAITHLEKSCSVKVLRVPRNSLCRPTYINRHRGLTLSSVGNGIRTYATGRIKLLHLTSKSLGACNSKGSSDKQIGW
ncbi:uncharacterized protein LOC123192823 [Mangifera indica]|uniref:uncharacterized protein LOC123192823 n=1 Tax=Mangifera indica TaxID=29780 RepID=UPI001CFA32AE|nr:uncharacterized protein LOC123192823 [Mangifera indica]